MGFSSPSAAQLVDVVCQNYTYAHPSSVLRAYLFPYANVVIQHRIVSFYIAVSKNLKTETKHNAATFWSLREESVRISAPKAKLKKDTI